MKETFKQIPTTMTKPLSPGQKVQKIMTEIGGGWYMKKLTKGLPPLRIPKQSKKAYKINIYIKVLGIGIIENSNYIGTSLNGSIQEVKSKGKIFIQFLQK